MTTDDANITARFTLTLGIAEEPDITPDTIVYLDMPAGPARDPDDLCTIRMPGAALRRPVAIAARAACQAIDLALKRHIETRGAEFMEILETDIDPTTDLQGGRP